MARASAPATSLCRHTDEAIQYADLVERLRQGDPRGWQELDAEVRLYLIELLRHKFSILPQDAEDIAQETLLKTFLNIGSLQNPNQLRTWISSIALNMARDQGRAERNHGKPITSSFNGNREEPGLPEPVALSEKPRAEHSWDINEKFGIPEEAWRVYQMKLVEGHSWSRVQELTGLSRTEAEVKFNRAKSAVEQLEKQGKELIEAMKPLPTADQKILELVEIQQMPVEMAAQKMGIEKKEAILLLSNARAAVFPKLFGPRWNKHDAEFVPEPFGEATRLALVEGLTQEEVAQRLSIPLGTAKSQIFRGKEAIRFLREDIPRYLESLPHDNQRAIARLYFVDGYTPREIAEILDKPLRAIVESMRNTRRHLLTYYERQTSRDEELRGSLPILIREREQANYQLALPEKAYEIQRGRLGALTAKGWTEEKIREVAQDFDARDKRILELAFFQGMTPTEVELHEGIPAADVRDRSHKIQERMFEFNPSNLPPLVMRRPSWTSLSKTIGWGEKVTDPQEVPKVVGNLVAQLSVGSMQHSARLVYLDGLSIEETASVLGASVRDVTKWLFDARKEMAALQYDSRGLAFESRSKEVASRETKENLERDATAEKEQKAILEKLILERLSAEDHAMARAYLIDGVTLKDFQTLFKVSKKAAQARRKEIREKLGIEGLASNQRWLDDQK